MAEEKVEPKVELKDIIIAADTTDPKLSSKVMIIDQLNKYMNEKEIANLVIKDIKSLKDEEIDYDLTTKSTFKDLLGEMIVDSEAEIKHIPAIWKTVVDAIDADEPVNEAYNLGLTYVSGENLFNLDEKNDNTAYLIPTIGTVVSDTMRGVKSDLLSKVLKEARKSKLGEHEVYFAYSTILSEVNFATINELVEANEPIVLMQVTMDKVIVAIYMDKSHELAKSLVKKLEKLTPVKDDKVVYQKELTMSDLNLNEIFINADLSTLEIIS